MSRPVWILAASAGLAAGLAVPAGALAQTATPQAERSLTQAARAFHPMPVFRPRLQLGMTLRRVERLRFGPPARATRCQQVDSRYSRNALRGSLGQPARGLYVRMVQGRLAGCGDLPPSRTVSRPLISGRRGALIRYGEGPGRRPFTLIWTRSGVRVMLFTNSVPPGQLVRMARSLERVAR